MISRDRLERVIGVPVTEMTHIEPWAVVRCRLADSTSVIVKWQRTDPTDWRTEPERLDTERGALEFSRPSTTPSHPA